MLEHFSDVHFCQKAHFLSSFVNVIISIWMCSSGYFYLTPESFLKTNQLRPTDPSAGKLVSLSQVNKT